MMSRLGRLLKLAEMSREHRAGTVKEMSRLCGVSQRTIFRYLKTLSKLNLPKELRTGTQKSCGCAKAGALDPDERCLLSFVLDHNPLIRNEYLARRLERIKAKLGDKITAENRALRRNLIEVDACPEVRKETSEDSITSVFASACKSNSRLLVKVRGKATELALVPHSIIIQNNGIRLLFSVPSRGEQVTYDLSSVESIRQLKQES